MNRYPHTSPWTAAIGVAAVVATVVTLGVAVILPARMAVGPDAAAAAMAEREAKPVEVTVTLALVEGAAARPAARLDSHSQSNSFSSMLGVLFARKPG